MDSRELAHALAKSAAPLDRLGAPHRRALLWLALSLPFVVAVGVAFGVDLGSPLEPRLIVEVVAAAATAILAANAAFASLVPGGRRRWLWLPLLPASVWIASLGAGCIADYEALGSAGLAFRADWACLGPMAAIGAVPALVIALMIRRGAPMMPRVTVGLAGLAVGALANVAMQTFHEGDISLMILIWHVGAVAVLTAIAAASGPLLLRWRS